MEAQSEVQKLKEHYFQTLSENEKKQIEFLKLQFIKEFPQEIEKHQYIAIRHAYSLYNYNAQQYKLDNNVKDDDEKTQNYQMNKELVDAPLHKYGILQATIASQLVNKINIGVIFCSPLRRTLQTTQILFRNYYKSTGKKLQVIVFPMITQSFNFVCELSPQTNTVVRSQFQKDQNLDFDFHLIDEMKNQLIWQCQIIADQKLRQKLERIISKYPDTQDGVIQGAIDNWIQCFPQHFETPSSTFARAKNAIQIIQQFLKANYSDLNQNAKICLVSHYYFLSSLLSEGINSEGKIVGVQDIQNCEFLPCSL